MLVHGFVAFLVYSLFTKKEEGAQNNKLVERE